MVAARPAGRIAGLVPLRHQLVAVLLALCCAAATTQVTAQQADTTYSGWSTVTDFALAGPGVEVSRVGPRQQPFPRPLPKSLDPQLLSDYLPALNLLQDLSLEGDNAFTDVSDQYVATIHDAFVEGEGGLVYDGASRVFHPPGFFFARTSPVLPLPQRSVAEAAATCERYDVLASAVQKYGHMYYHFLEEELPRVALLAASGRLTSDVKLLTWGQPYEYEYLEALGVSRSQIVPYNASRVYCADRLLVPTPTPRITPPREGLALVRQGLGVQVLPEAQRDLVIYVSRKLEPTRRVDNEEEILAAIRAAFPQQQLVIFYGGLSAGDTMKLFQRAKVVLGPHGAGLSHILFSAPGTTVIEFLFLADPPLMFWHAAAALGQDYWLLPVPQGHWMQVAMQVPAAEVVDILTAVLNPQPAPASACPSGTHASQSDASCASCAPGTYAFLPGSPACKPCAPGRVATPAGATACRTCQPGTYSTTDGTLCAACPDGTFSVLPGAWSAGQCLTPEERRRQQEDDAASVQLLSKLSPVFAEQRRRLVEQGGSATLTQAALCATQGGTASDLYRGPYLLGGYANCTSVMQQVAGPPAFPAPAVVAEPPPPAPLVLPPIDVPTLPPLLLPPPPAAEVVELQSLSPPMPRVTVAVAPAPQAPAPEPTASFYPEKKKVVDNYVIILACVLGGLAVLPLLVCLIRRCVLARQRSKARAAAAASAPMLAGAAPLAYSNPTFQPDQPALARGSPGEKEALHMM